MSKKTDNEQRKERRKKLEEEGKLKVLEFTPREEEGPDDFGDILHDIINAGEEEEEGRFHEISYAKKGVVIVWNEETDMLHAHVHGMSNMELNYLLQRMIVNIHVDLS